MIMNEPIAATVSPVYRRVDWHGKVELFFWKHLETFRLQKVRE